MKKAILQLHLAVLLAGFTGILGRLITLKEGPLVWYRMGITTIAMIIFLMWKGKLKKISIKEIWGIAYVGFLLGIHWLCFYGSIKYANVSIALVCFSASAFFSAFLDPIIMKHKFSLKETLLSLIAILGIYIIMHFDKRYVIGIILGLMAAFFSALFTVLSKRLTRKHDPYTMTLYELGAGFVFITFLLPFYLYIFPHTVMVPTTLDWVYLLILSIACTVWAFILVFSSLKKVSSFTTNLTYNLEPVYGILLAFLIFHENESLNKNFYWGFALIAISVGLQSLRMLHVRRRLQRKLPARFKIPWG
ncbi:MAG: DMT family transporter [Chitinophagaceae bacterium]